MNHDEAILRYSTAKGYIQACKMIVLSDHYKDQNVVATILPLHMLGGFALELYLKAWLLGSGRSSKDVRGYGHDIKNLYDDAKTDGLREIDKLKEMKDHFADPHSDFTYRYIGPGDQMDNTNWPSAFRAFDELDREVDGYLGASSSYGLQAGH